MRPLSGTTTGDRSTVENEQTWRDASENEAEPDAGPTEIPYDAGACDLFLACLRYIVDTCAAQGAALGVQYELDYRDMIARVITTPSSAGGSTVELSADQLATVAAMHRAARQNETGAVPEWKAAQ